MARNWTIRNNINKNSASAALITVDEQSDINSFPKNIFPGSKAWKTDDTTSKYAIWVKNYNGSGNAAYLTTEICNDDPSCVSWSGP